MIFLLPKTKLFTELLFEIESKPVGKNFPATGRPPESFVVETPSGPVRFCFHLGDISFAACCDERFGPSGNEECWDSFDTFEECLGPFYSPRI